MGISGKKIPHYIQPMLATSVDKPFNSKDWLFELKLDGFRAVAELNKGKLLLYSRNGLSMIKRYPTIESALKKLKTDVVLDGEIVLFNENGRPDFQKLQNYGRNKEYHIVYYVFDILRYQDQDLTVLPLVERKKILKKILKKTGDVRFCSHIETHGEDFFKAVKSEDMEGIIAKRKESYYTPGVRTKEWLKIKNHKSQEAIIVGYTQPKGSRLHFGSLLLAQYEKDKLRYIGHAGTGFTEAGLKEILSKMEPLQVKKSPLDTLIKVNSPVTWVKPKLVCEVSYSEITKDGILRHPVFKGLRTEKKSTSIQADSERPMSVKKLVKNSKHNS